MKKFIAVLSIILIIECCFLCAYANDGSSLESASALLKQLDVMKGDENGDMRLNDTITRAEFTKAAVMASEYKSSVALNMPISPFVDVPYTYWAAPYIKIAGDNGFVNGYLDSTFRPEENILYEEAVAILLNFLGYTSSDYGNSWPQGPLSIADKIGLSTDVDAYQGVAITRENAVMLFYNLMNCNKKDTNNKYINFIGYTYYENAVINGVADTDPSLKANEVNTSCGVFKSNSFDNNYLGTSGNLLVNSKSEIVDYLPTYLVTIAVGQWKSDIGINSESVICYRNGRAVGINEILSYDIVYYYPASGVIQAYSNKITAIYESASPNKETPTTIVASGSTYTIETYSAFRALSSAGSFSYGDTIVMLMGKDGKIAGVSAANSDNVTKYGFLIDAGTKQSTDDNGKNYSSYYATIVLTDGNTGEYKTNKDYSSVVNNVVRLNFENELVALSRYNVASTVYGVVNSGLYTIGNSSVSSDVQILEVNNTDEWKTPTYKSVFLQRLDGMSLNSKSILLSTTDSAGRITNLILKNVTGDLDEYVMLLQAKDGTYTINSDGAIETIRGSSFSVSGYQPVKIVYDGNSISSITKLNKLSSYVSEFNDTEITVQDTKYPLADNVKIYQKTNMYEYMFITMDDLKAMSDVKITAYYDKAVSAGGRIRALIVE